MSKKTDNIEYEKRIRIVQEWIIEDWPYSDIITQVKQKWQIAERQAKRYIAEARERWVKDQQDVVDSKRTLKVEGLKKLKRSLQEKYEGTPQGIFAVLSVEKELIKLEGLERPKKIEVKDITDYSKFPITFE
jgi:hypothetical protein